MPPDNDANICVHSPDPGSRMVKERDRGDRGDRGDRRDDRRDDGPRRREERGPPARQGPRSEGVREGAGATMRARKTFGRCGSLSNYIT